MSGNSNNTDLTFRDGLLALGETSGGLAYEHFKSRNFLDSTGQQWSHPNIYNHLRSIYTKGLIRVHSDKGGTGCVKEFMLVREAWAMFKGCYVRLDLVDMTLNSDTDDDDGDDDDDDDDDNDGDGDDVDICDDAKEDESVDDEQQQNDNDVDVYDDDDLFDSSNDDAKEDAEQASDHDEATTGGMLAKGTVQPFSRKQCSKFDKMIGTCVQKMYWFVGKIVSIKQDVKVGSELPCLYNVKYDDGDGEDLTFEEFQNLTMCDDCATLKGQIGYTFWKGFRLDGKVVKVHYAQHDNAGKTLSHVLSTFTHHSETLLIIVTQLLYPLPVIWFKAHYFECRFNDLDDEQYLTFDECSKCMYTKKRSRRSRSDCGCVTCLKEDCGVCVNCIDMVKHGGQGKRKKRCKERKCSTKNSTKEKMSE